MPGLDLIQPGLYFFALLDGVWTTRMKAATGRGIHRRRHIAVENDATPLCFNNRIRNGHRGDESSRVWHQWFVVNSFCAGQLDQLSQIHYSHTIRNMPDG